VVIRRIAVNIPYLGLLFWILFGVCKTGYLTEWFARLSALLCSEHCTVCLAFITWLYDILCLLVNNNATFIFLPYFLYFCFFILICVVLLWCPATASRTYHRGVSRHMRVFPVPVRSTTWAVRAAAAASAAVVVVSRRASPRCARLDAKTDVTRWVWKMSTRSQEKRSVTWSRYVVYTTSRVLSWLFISTAIWRRRTFAVFLCATRINHWMSQQYRQNVRCCFYVLTENYMRFEYNHILYILSSAILKDENHKHRAYDTISFGHICRYSCV